jgi:hypothetical protein
LSLLCCSASLCRIWLVCSALLLCASSAGGARTLFAGGVTTTTAACDAGAIAAQLSNGGFEALSNSNSTEVPGWQQPGRDHQMKGARMGRTR